MAKRRKPSSSPMGAIFTRSRSESLLHRTRSGRVRPDPRPRHNHLISTPPTTSPHHAFDLVDGSIHTSIKDLRARRVFSPASIDCFPGQTAKIETDDDRPDKIDAPEKGGSDDSGEEDPVQSTPPDGDLLCKLGSVEGGEMVGFGAESVDRTTKVSSDDRRADGGFCLSRNPSKNRLGLVPCSRLKLFRNPSSFGYRRLLPFLMDLTKDGSSGVEILPCQNYPIKAEKSMEERPSLSKMDPAYKEQHQAVGGSEGSPIVQLRENLDFAENYVTDNPILKPPKDDVDDRAITLLPDLCGGIALPVHGATAETSPRGSVPELELLYKSSYCPRNTHEALSVQELTGNEQTISYLPRKAEEASRKTVLSLDLDGKPPLEMSQSGALHPRGRYALAPRKGILKKHQRGCRGLCMCLDCASFRVHAERAFEFSRKQMQETDEVVMGLMKELSYLRNLVEKSVVPIVHGSGTDAVLQLNQDQVKGVCQRASRAEKVATNCLRQMVHDLNSHCRIPGHRVTFAEAIEERVIP